MKQNSSNWRKGNLPSLSWIAFEFLLNVKQARNKGGETKFFNGMIINCMIMDVNESSASSMKSEDDRNSRKY